MCAAMVHRGPDDSGAQTSGEATFGMRRLAIIDPANGHQPMTSPDGRHVLVFNGSIVNFRSLREELTAHWTFRTHCDTEVLLAAFLHWGEGCLGRLRGMFAFAVWDAAEQTLYLARDPFGIKPLYYRHDGKRFVFASEINALVAGGVAPEIDPLAVADYLAWFSVPAPRTIYRGILSLRPGESATFRAGRLSLRRTWSFRDIPRDTRPCAPRARNLPADCARASMTRFRLMRWPTSRSAPSFRAAWTPRSWSDSCPSPAALAFGPFPSGSTKTPSPRRRRRKRPRGISGHTIMPRC